MLPHRPDWKRRVRILRPLSTPAHIALLLSHHAQPIGHNVTAVARPLSDGTLVSVPYALPAHSPPPQIDRGRSRARYLDSLHTASSSILLLPSPPALYRALCVGYGCGRRRQARTVL